MDNMLDRRSGIKTHKLYVELKITVLKQKGKTLFPNQIATRHLAATGIQYVLYLGNNAIPGDKHMFKKGIKPIYHRE